MKSNARGRAKVRGGNDRREFKSLCEREDYLEGEGGGLISNI